MDSPTPPPCAATVVAPIRIVIYPAQYSVAWRCAQRHRMANGATVTFTSPAVETYHSTVRLFASRAMDGRLPIKRRHRNDRDRCVLFRLRVG